MFKTLYSLAGQWLPAVLFGLLLIVGLCHVRDYGTYIDEFTNHHFGIMWYDYARHVFTGGSFALPANVTEHDVVHGPFIEMLFAFIEDKIVHLPDLRHIVFLRHYGTWIVFYLGAVCFYLLAQKLFASRKLALLAAAFLVLHPRIFSHAFYDSIDIPLLSFYILALYTWVRYLEKRTPGALCVHAVACGLLVDIRLIGGVIPAITGTLLLLELLSAKTSDRRWSRIPLYLGTLAITILAFWPFLWSNPPLRALEVLRQTPRVAWDGLVLYMGQYISATKLPWHYIPVWIAITTPIACTVFFLVGLPAGIVAFFKNPARFYRERPGELAVMAAFLLPLLAVILLRPVVFDSWRHMFFIYPAFVLVAVAGVKKVVTEIDARFGGRARFALHGAIAAFIAVNLASTVWFMIGSHPYQNVYFNRLAGRDMKQVKSRFDLDYWGLSYLHALEYLVRKNPAGPLRIYDPVKSLPLVNMWMLTPADRDRIEIVDFNEADFVLTNFRILKEGYPALSEYFTIKVEGEPIVCIYTRRPFP